MLHLRRAIFYLVWTKLWLFNHLNHLIDAVHYACAVFSRAFADFDNFPFEQKTFDLQCLSHILLAHLLGLILICFVQKH